MSAFCAICTSEDGPLQSVRVDGRTVTACARCCSEHPRSGGYSFGGGRAAGSAVRMLSDGNGNTVRGKGGR